jgi:photosystem II stability/assembly factor-like uncharacterized protein
MKFTSRSVADIAAQRNFEQVEVFISTYLIVGAGDPEGEVAGEIGALYLRTDGGAATTLYVKEADGGLDTGWEPK